MGQSASKVKFRESVSALIQVDVSADDADFWDELWKIPSSAAEVFELLPAASARKLRDEKFDNLATLFTQAVAQLCQIVETPYSIYFDQALNCVRVLTRILPFLLEKGDLGEADENVEQLCWGTGGPNPTDERIGLMIGGNELGTSQQAPPSVAKHRAALLKEQEDELNHRNDNEDEQEPLALLVVHAAMHMLFLPQFTCDFYEDASISKDPRGKNAVKTKRRAEDPAAAKDDRELKAEAGLRERKVDWGVSLDAVPASIVWAPGAGVVAADMGYDASTRKYDKNRVEVLRLMLAACCDPLFSPADEYNPLASRWLAVATAADAPNAICLFYSLLNTIVTYDTRHLPVAAGFSEGHHVKLVELSAQVLCVLLDCGLPGHPDPVVDQNESPCVEFEIASKGGFNIFRTLLARIDTSRELTLIYEGFARLLRNVYEAESTYMGGVKLQCFQELLVLFWKFLEENPLFMSHILTRCNVNDIIVPICFLMYKSRRDPAQIGLVHICTFVLLKLSGERSFGVCLNKPFNVKLPTDLPLFHGCHADLLTITLHKLVVNGAYKLVPLYSCFLTIIANTSPYWKSMSLVAAVKLVNLFELFSSPKFLYSGEFAYRHLALLLEVFNNIAQYQYHGNAHLVYAIVRRKDAFGQLVSLSLQKAQAQCHKVYGDQTTVARDVDAQPVSLDTKGIPNLTNMPSDEDNSQSQSSSVIGTPFQPTAEWLEELKANLPMETVTRLLQHLVPVVDEIVARKAGVVDEQEILNVLNEITMVGLLPVPHPIVIRKYQPNQYTALWFTAFMWGVIFLRNQSLPLFDGQCIELFQVSVQDEED
ncbi:hypothetical protein MPSEU_000049500 [Mayamaea pseudoterrestris]|nr:hypothetical protein MPSEU_000049500 [Mayamaea pseudoterrestris]